MSSRMTVAGSVEVPKSVLAADRTDTALHRRVAALGGIPYAISMKLEKGGRSRRNKAATIVATLRISDAKEGMDR